ncbi:MAG: alpha-L-fucosidase [Planctomycetes bacterium]|nr:alpha-L-fucosidase [Planctomycetota bacterium]
MRALAAVLPFVAAALAQEPPTWDQLDARPIPSWFQDAKFGIFIHWGVYSVPSYCHTSTYSEWYQHWLDTNSHDGFVTKFHERVYGKDFTYRDFAPQFRAELWDPAEWAKIFQRAGADYIVITSKHHDGYALWPDAVGSAVRGYPWNAQAIGPERDLLGELAAAVRKEGIRFGLYYSFLEWHNPLFDKDKPAYVDQVVFPQVKDLIARYQPSVFWPDGEWEHPDTLWRSRELVHWLRENAPNRGELVVNDRWGKGCRGEHGDYYTTEYGGYGGSKTYLGQKPFEECRGIGHSFAFNRAEGYDLYLSRTECVRTLIDLVSRGGKLLLDIGPDGDGTIPLIMVDRLLAIGDWLKVHGEAITGCDRSPFLQTPWGRATQKGDTVYLQVYDWPRDGILAVPELVILPQKSGHPTKEPAGSGAGKESGVCPEESTRASSLRRSAGSWSRASRSATLRDALGINRNMLTRWKSEIEGDGAEAFRRQREADRRG